MGAGAKHQLVFVDRLLATLVYLRHGTTHDVLACWWTAPPSPAPSARCAPCSPKGEHCRPRCAAADPRRGRRLPRCQREDGQII
ncbi:transposase family protein [Streptomyces sp. NPDC087317]|uniref:transposase family protein n=1 Tax=Streptomyces sp. NPDC087317 TaxID=3365784 RepID=UPI0037FD52FA